MTLDQRDAIAAALQAIQDMADLEERYLAATNFEAQMRAAMIAAAHLRAERVRTLYEVMQPSRLWTKQQWADHLGLSPSRYSQIMAKAGELRGKQDGYG